MDPFAFEAVPAFRVVFSMVFLSLITGSRGEGLTSFPHGSPFLPFLVSFHRSEEHPPRGDCKNPIFFLLSFPFFALPSSKKETKVGDLTPLVRVPREGKCTFLQASLWHMEQ